MTYNRRKYDSEFKRNAVLLSNEEGRSISEVAQGLGVKAEILYRWRKEFSTSGEIAFCGSGNKVQTEQDKHIAELEKKLKDMEMQRDILKKTLAIFSKTQK